jgi:hypothetical protein
MSTSIIANTASLINMTLSMGINSVSALNNVTIAANQSSMLLVTAVEELSVKRAIEHLAEVTKMQADLNISKEQYDTVLSSVRSRVSM